MYCYLCGKRRTCRIDRMNRYYQKMASSELVIPVCLSNCSRYRHHEKENGNGKT